MTFKKLLLCALILALALPCAAAQAQTLTPARHPVNPYASRVAQLMALREKPRANAYGYGPMGEITCTVNGVPLVDGAVLTDVSLFETGAQFMVDAEHPDGGVEGRSVTVEYQICHTSSNFHQGDVVSYKDTDWDDGWNYRFLTSADDLELDLFFFSSDGEFIDWQDYTFSVFNEAYPSAQQVAASVAASCAAEAGGDEYRLALLLHDWLMDHCRYDYTYSNYGAESALVGGTGVCDSYSKAYVLLLEAAGIDCVRLTGLGNGGNHAWNAVKIDGAWAQVDCTWDDTDSSTYYEGLSEAEAHFYFCLNDALMRRDHTYADVNRPEEPEGSALRDKDPNYDTIGACTTLANHYFIRDNVVDYWTGDFIDGIEDQLGEGYRFSVEAPSSVSFGGWYYPSGYKNYIVYGLTAYALSQREWVYDGEPLELDIAYDEDLPAMVGQVRFDDRVYRLPDDILEIGEEAFAGDGNVMAIEVPSGVERIGARAFAGCGSLWVVSLPDGDIDIDDDAFSGASHLTIVCPSGSSAAAFAEAHGLRWEEP